MYSPCWPDKSFLNRTQKALTIKKTLAKLNYYKILIAIFAHQKAPSTEAKGKPPAERRRLQHTQPQRIPIQHIERIPKNEFKKKKERCHNTKIGKRYEKHFAKDISLIIVKHVGKDFTSRQVNSNSNHHTLITYKEWLTVKIYWVKFKKVKINIASVGEDVEQLEPPYTLMGVRSVSTLWRTVWKHMLKLNICTPYPFISLRGIYPTKTLTNMYQKSYTKFGNNAQIHQQIEHQSSSGTLQWKVKYCWPRQVYEWISQTWQWAKEANHKMYCMIS